VQAVVKTKGKTIFRCGPYHGGAATLPQMLWPDLFSECCFEDFTIPTEDAADAGRFSLHIL